MLKKVLGTFNINLHKIVASNETVLNSFSKEDCDTDANEIKLDNSMFHKTLGIVRNVNCDSLRVSVDLPNRPFTKRGVLSVINSPFDPIGMASPVVLKGKIFQRSILPRNTDRKTEITKLDWDDPLPVEQLKLWEDWQNSLQDLSRIAVPRSIVPKNFGTVSKQVLHTFCDEFEDAIGHVIYVQSFNNLGDEILVKDSCMEIVE